MIKKIVSMFMGATALMVPFAFTMPALAVSPQWDATGEYVVAVEYQGTDYMHDMSLTQDSEGDLTGNGGSPVGSNVYMWGLTSGEVDGNTIDFLADYTATMDAVTPQTTMHVVGVIAEDGSMSGTWSDNYMGEDRSGVWETTTGYASSSMPIATSSDVTVTIEKFVQGAMATALTANNSDFPMSSTWDAENLGAGTGEYSLSETNTVPYQAVTAQMTKGADYSTKELVNGSVVGAECADGKPFALSGYTTGDTKAAAMTATKTMSEPTFTNLQTSKYVIVWNTNCTEPTGELGGEVVGEDGQLQVTSIEMIDTSATANGTFTDGWEYVFHITAPTSEENITMKFSDWLRTEGAGTIPVANNMRISSAQANNGGATILLTAANTYSTPPLVMDEDLDPVMAGRQVEVTVEVAVPAGTPNGSYTTSYGVQSNP